MSTIEREIIERLQQLQTDKQQQVLEFIERLQFEQSHHYSPLDLLALPEEDQNRIIAESFRLAENEDFETFEAYSEESIDDNP